MISASGLLLYIFLFSQSAAYQPDEGGGLLTTLTGKEKPAYLAKEPLPRVFEKNNHGQDSCVLRIEGSEQFKQFVLECPKPVVLLVWAPTSLDSLKMKPVFMQVAEGFKDQVQFVSMDLLFEQDKALPNYHIVAGIMQAQGITKIDIPLMVFLKNGSLFTPSYFPTAFLQGHDTAENLAQKVRAKFFPESMEMKGVEGTDVPGTTTVPMGAVFVAKAPKPQKTKRAWWRRVFGK